MTFSVTSRASRTAMPSKKGESSHPARTHRIRRPCTLHRMRADFLVFVSRQFWRKSEAVLTHIYDGVTCFTFRSPVQYEEEYDSAKGKTRANSVTGGCTVDRDAGGGGGGGYAGPSSGGGGGERKSGVVARWNNEKGAPIHATRGTVQLMPCRDLGDFAALFRLWVYRPR
jgi:hypothetical protein